MAKVDITGLLTGLAGTPDLEREGIKRASAIQGQGVGSNLARSLALQAPQREQMMRQGAGGLFGVDTRTAGQQVQEQLGQLDTSTPEGQKQAVQLIAQVDPTRALALQTQFNTRNKEEERYATAEALEQEKVDIARLRLKGEKAAKTATELKFIKAATDESRSQGALAREMIGIAEGYEKWKPRAGAVGKTFEGLNEFFGTQGGVESLRKRFEAVRVRATMDKLPPGAASDKDVALALGTFPTAYWSPDEISSYLRGQAKLAAYVAEQEGERAKWLSANQGDDSGFADVWATTAKSDEFKQTLKDNYGFEWEPAEVIDGSALVPTVNSQRARSRSRRGRL